MDFDKKRNPLTVTSSEFQKCVSWQEVRSCCIMLHTILYFSEIKHKEANQTEANLWGASEGQR